MSDGAWIAPTLTAELDRYPQLDPRERGLCTELVYGTIRSYHWLLGEIKSRTNAGGVEDVGVLAHMLLASYQALVLDRIPAHAAIDAAVGSIRRDRDSHVAGFANAVLRRVVREVKRPTAEELARGSVPRWLRERTEKSIGKEASRAFFAERHELPSVSLRVHATDQTETWIARLRASIGANDSDTTFEPSDLPGCILVKNAGRLEALEGFGEAWVPQDYGSQWIAHAVGAKPGERVLDACAGRGQKTAMLTDAVGPGGRVDAADLHPKKLEEIAHAGAHTFAVDWTLGTGEADPPYDRILVDAPCSGTGTIGRRPEILLRLRDADLKELRAKQLAITAQVAPLLAPGGTLVYSVCSVLREEGEQVVEALRERVPSLTLESTSRILPPAQPSDGFFIATLRHTPS